jgi:hypothetical protein
MKTAVNRETWLREAYSVMRMELLREAPVTVAIAWSFPSSKAASRTRPTVGQCWQGGGIRGKIEGGRAILISPSLHVPLDILHVLLHEMVHATLPTGVGHGAKFSQTCARIGLVKPWTATTPGPLLKEKLEAILKKLPAWPEGSLVIRPKETGRQLKGECPCGRILRGSKKFFNDGPVICGLCSKPFEMEA